MDPDKYIATCAAGLETLLAEELVLLGGKVDSTTSVGAVTFSGTLESAYRACLWSRFASRILLPVMEFAAPDTDSLYRGISAMDWNSHFGVEQTFAVECAARHSAIEHTRYASLRIKDAVVDQFRQRCNSRPSIDVNRPDVRIHVRLDGEQATVSLDLSGDSLHKRGYRTAGGEAPLKETLAAGILHLTGWQQRVFQDDILLDPMCGTGTLLIEAVLMRADIAPGLRRDYFGFVGLQGHDRALWERLTAEARRRRQLGLKNFRPRIIGYDACRTVIRAALENIENAGLRGIIHVERRELAQLQNPLKKNDDSVARGFLVVNPPYGQRLGSSNEVKYLYRCLGRKLKEEFCGWRAGVFTHQVELADAVGINSIKTHRLFNGPLACRLHLFDVPSAAAGARPAECRAPRRESLHDAEAFANRLRKNLKHLSKWVRRESISCYRVYDADIPEYNLAVDLYEQWVHVQEYAPPKTVDPAKASERFKQALRALQEVLGVHRRQVFIKVRSKQKGRGQYQKKGNQNRFLEVQEQNCRLLVNMTDYLDTGLFLDQRITRSMIQQKAAGTRYLNLFGYTGAATVHAAMGGAKTTTTVDSSKAYLKWARSNLALNGFGEENHRMVQADCLDWLSKTRDRFDLIFIDPPTFSNTKSSREVFDVQRDHVKLIRSAMGRLENEGLLIFSSNFRRFKIDAEALSEFIMTNITRETIPPDFNRNQRIHQCRLIRKSK